MIVFAFLFMYWIVAVILAVIFNRCKVTGFTDDSTTSAILWPLTIFYYVVIYPFYYIDEKFSNSKSRR
jgi:hypothetical protein